MIILDSIGALVLLTLLFLGIKGVLNMFDKTKPNEKENDYEL